MRKKHPVSRLWDQLTRNKNKTCHFIVICLIWSQCWWCWRWCWEWGVLIEELREIRHQGRSGQIGTITLHYIGRLGPLTFLHCAFGRLEPFSAVQIGTIPLHYITLHSITLHYIGRLGPLHYIPLHWQIGTITLHCITLHWKIVTISLKWESPRVPCPHICVVCWI